ncbi:CpsD/CapB family tyrosine-protein kinase [Rhizobiaceae bacterium n13]|uniref:CpsD/CapB family tyrosine-protein kinase n=2 Tax=Ferirhizobium litorale TaxID=2927786 RepID=A0AAE3TZE0_9HYPH|nr:CpsD/CapB family tyrosine-protein kinase [Fererhizobium litorale]MDI7860741.1 CpsD/CapB family tyrosine-protein kinase [Fererhizobium litorale]MDI7920889.1 CpsD/CapB family tyrosine-protein kinase [Fererhizobium litorale]
MNWEELSPLSLDPDVIARNRIVTTNRSDHAHAAFDMLRTKLLHAIRQNNWNRVAITSPTPACGKTFIALNLAFSLGHQTDCRTLLLDLDLRRPQVGKTLGIRNMPSMESFLKGDSPARDVFLRHGDNLAIAANRQPVHYSAELLQSPVATETLQDLRQRMNPDVILFDLPPMLSNDDVLAFLPNVDCVILVAAADYSTLNEVDVCERELAEKTNVLGVVLNKCRYSPEKYGY